MRPPRRVGRERELQALARAWSAGVTWVLLAEAGIGKRRLLGELAESHQGVTAVQARPGDAGVAGAVIARLLRAVLGPHPMAMTAARTTELALRICATVTLALGLSACQTLPPPVVAPPVVVAPPIAQPAPPAPPKPPRIGLALGGGAARGFAHIGVIQVLEEAGIQPDLVVGTSAGSLVAALYASGKSGRDLATLARFMDEGAITDWSFPGRGLIRGEALARYVREQTAARPIEQMSLPLGIVATDLDSGAPILFQRGDTGSAVRASSAVPAVFQPVRIGNREYVDGGLVSPVPVRFARQMGAQMVIAVDISAPPEGAPTGDAFRLLLQTFAIMGQSINHFELRDADIVLRPSLAGVGSADFAARSRAIAAGREAALALLPALRSRITALTK